MPVNVVNFTEAKLAQLQLAAPTLKARTDYRDPAHKGLLLRVSPSGALTWSCLHRLSADRVHRETLGRWPDVTCKRAIERNRAHGGLVAEGKSAAQLHTAMHGEPTFGEAIEQYLAQRTLENCRSVLNMRQYIERYVGKMPEQLQKKHGKLRTKARCGVDWSARKLSEITADDCAALHARIAKTGHFVTANRVFQIISAIYGFMKIQHRALLNPVTGLARAKEKSRVRFLKTPEVPKFFDALEKLEQDWQDYYMVSLFIGYRGAALQAMNWKDVDLDMAFWEVPAPNSKNTEATIIPLGKLPMKILRRRFKETGGHGWVFPGGTKAGHIGKPKYQWNKLVKLCGLADFTPHDLRRTLGSWMAMNGASLPKIGQQLGHKDMQSTQIYARLDLESVTEAADSATAKLLSKRTAPQPAAPAASNVHPIKKSA